MKNHFKIYKIAFVTLAMTIIGCENTLSPTNSETLNPSFVKAYAANGVVEGPINQPIDVTVEFNHPSPNLSVKSIQKNVIDGFTAEYTIIVGESGSKDTFDLVTVSYDIIEAGVHTLNFFYQLEDEESEFLGKFEFAINN